jgi:hypothetical protein
VSAGEVFTWRRARGCCGFALLQLVCWRWWLSWQWVDQAIAGPLGRLARGSEAAGERLAPSDAQSFTGRLPRFDERREGGRAASSSSGVFWGFAIEEGDGFTGGGVAEGVGLLGAFGEFGHGAESTARAHAKANIEVGDASGRKAFGWHWNQSLPS